MRGIGLLLISALLFGSQEEEMIKNITSPKKTLTDSQISLIKDPFEKPAVISDTNKTISPLRFDIKAILDNTALINGKWLKIGDKVNNYRILQIGKNSVLINDGKETKTLYLFKGGR